MVIRPNGYAIWERMQAEVDGRIKAAGVIARHGRVDVLINNAANNPKMEPGRRRVVAARELSLWSSGSRTSPSG